MLKVTEILRLKGNALYTGKPDMSVAQAIRTMSERDIGSMVIMESGTLVGMLTFREVIRLLHNQGEIGDTTVRAIMDDAPVSVSPNTEADELRRDMAVATYEKAIQSAFRDVADALAARRWLADQLVVQREALAAQSERARLARLRYNAGSAAFLEVLDAQRDLLAAEQQRVQTQRALLSSQVALYTALGGGSRVLGAVGASPRP